MRNGKKMLIAGTSMVKGISMKEVNRQLRNSFEKLRSFLGATLKHLKYYIAPSVIDETPGRIILLGGCNDVNKKAQLQKRLPMKYQIWRYYVVIMVLMISLYQR